MWRRFIYYLGYFVIFFFGISFIIVFFKMGRLEREIAEVIALYGFTAILVVAFIADLLMQPIGPDIPIILGLMLHLSPVLVVFFAGMGSLAASIAGYYLGRWYGEEGFKKFHGYSKFDKWSRRYEKYGKLIVLLGALTPVPYTLICWISGIFRMKVPEFLVFGVAARILRFIGVAFVTLQFV